MVDPQFAGAEGDVRPTISYSVKNDPAGHGLAGIHPLFTEGLSAWFESTAIVYVQLKSGPAPLGLPESKVGVMLALAHTLRATAITPIKILRDIAVFLRGRIALSDSSVAIL
jgi:hypothetical protein